MYYTCSVYLKVYILMRSFSSRIECKFRIKKTAVYFCELVHGYKYCFNRFFLYIFTIYDEIYARLFFIFCVHSLLMMIEEISAPHRIELTFTAPSTAPHTKANLRKTYSQRSYTLYIFRWNDRICQYRFLEYRYRYSYFNLCVYLKPSRARQWI